MNNAWRTRAAGLLASSHLGLLTLVPLVLYIAYLGHFGLSNADTYFHVRSGEEMLSGSWRPWAMGHFSSMDSDEWVSTQWLPQLLMGLTVKLGGLTLLMWVAMVSYLSFFATVWLILRSYGPPVLVGLSLLAFAWACESYVSLRPQMFSFLFMLILTHLFLRAAERKETPWLVLPLLTIWPNFHGMWIAGLVSLWALALAYGVQHGFRHSYRVLLLIPLATLATLANPIGPKLWIGTLDAISTGAGTSQLYTEWGPPSYSDPHLFVGFLILALTVLYFTGRQASVVQRAVLLLALGWGLWSQRSVPFALLMLLLLILPAAGHFAPAGKVALREAALALTLFTAGLGAFALTQPPSPTWYMGVPPWLDQRLDSLPDGSVVYTDFPLGSYSLQQYPDLQVFVHGYVDAFTDDEENRLLTITLQRRGWPEALQATGARYAALPKYSSISYGLELEGWTTIEGDENYLLMTPPPDWPKTTE